MLPEMAPFLFLFLIYRLTVIIQVRSISAVTQAIANGDMSQTIDVEANGEIQVLKETINNMVSRLSSFCYEVQRVAKDVGVDGKMGAQADIAGLNGRWKEITTDVNTMASNLVSHSFPSEFACMGSCEISKSTFMLTQCLDNPSACLL